MFSRQLWLTSKRQVSCPDFYIKDFYIRCIFYSEFCFLFLLRKKRRTSLSTFTVQKSYILSNFNYVDTTHFEQTFYWFLTTINITKKFVHLTLRGDLTQNKGYYRARSITCIIHIMTKNYCFIEIYKGLRNIQSHLEKTLLPYVVFLLPGLNNLRKTTSLFSRVKGTEKGLNLQQNTS